MTETLLKLIRPKFRKLSRIKLESLYNNQVSIFNKDFEKYKKNIEEYVAEQTTRAA